MISATLSSGRKCLGQMNIVDGYSNGDSGGDNDDDSNDGCGGVDDNGVVMMVMVTTIMMAGDTMMMVIGFRIMTMIVTMKIIVAMSVNI